MNRKLGPEIREKGKRNASALREILRLHRPDDETVRDPEPMLDVVQGGQLLRLTPALAEMALASTGTDDECPLPYRD